MITVKAGSTVTFMITTHADTGANTNADSTPSYTIRSTTYSSVSGPTNFTNATTGVYYGSYATGSSTANGTMYFVFASVTIGGVTQTLLVETIRVMTYDDNDALHSGHYGTAQAGASGSITLASTASSTTNFYLRSYVVIVGGTGAGQARIISSYNGTTKVATIENGWATNPDSTSVYQIYAGMFPAATSNSGYVYAYTTSGDAIMPAAGNTGTNGLLLADEEDVYPAYVDVVLDDDNSQDEYTVTWYRNGTLQTSNITAPTITVTQRSDGSDIISAQTMTQIGSTGSYKYDESVNRIGRGETALVTVSAIINGVGPKTWRKLVSRDSA